MEVVEHCPRCHSSQLASLGYRSISDPYLNLVDERLNKEKRSWFQCKHCKLRLASPRITHEEASILYSHYRDPQFRGIHADDYFHKLTSIPQQESETWFKAHSLLEFINPEVVHRILDVGCGGGILLYHIQKLFPGSELIGLELNENYASMVEEQLELRVERQEFSKTTPKGNFDLILSTDVIEHMHQPRFFWEACKNKLNPGGFLFIEVPSPLCFQHLPLNHDVFASPHLYFFEPQHLIADARSHSMNLIHHLQKCFRDVDKDLYLFQMDTTCVDS